MALHWNIEECAAYFDRLFLRGWCHDSTHRIVRVMAVFPEPMTVVPVLSFGQPSPDVAGALDARAANCRFEEWLDLPAEAAGRDFYLRFFFENQRTIVGHSALGKAKQNDPFHRCWSHFLEELQSIPAGTVLEIGSRARSAITRRETVPPHLDYIGVDILPGPNVDVVGDVHDLGNLFPDGQFVAAFSFSVFEHLAMPWKVALELNRLLAPGGLVFTQTHQTWPMHEEPWDFWRFSRHSWQMLFNSATGFEVVEAACGEPAHLHAFRTTPATLGLPHGPAFLGSASIVRKIAGTDLTWPVGIETAAHEMYPAGELSEPPR
ncbi:MAG: class I SAM-dependent methyltransferase [Verrucomicrobia bacterium]|nr:class I SAM-dependent methyltransferase [Verrucomicrobiota bacterium]